MQKSDILLTNTLFYPKWEFHLDLLTLMLWSVVCIHDNRSISCEFWTLHSFLSAREAMKMAFPDLKCLQTSPSSSSSPVQFITSENINQIRKSKWPQNELRWYGDRWWCVAASSQYEIRTKCSKTCYHLNNNLKCARLSFQQRLQSLWKMITIAPLCTAGWKPRLHTQCTYKGDVNTNCRHATACTAEPVWIYYVI